ncbi:TPA: hypothetical protein H5X67_002273 [Escherichia coli]|nr:hypothetical protein [Escherichia coli]
MKKSLAQVSAGGISSLNLRDKAFTPHLATNALPDIKVPENISGLFIPQPNS